MSDVSPAKIRHQDTYVFSRPQQRIIESLRLEKTYKITKSNHQPNTTMPAKPYPQVPHLLHLFLNTSRDGDSTTSLGISCPSLEGQLLRFTLTSYGLKHSPPVIAPTPTFARQCRDSTRSKRLRSCNAERHPLSSKKAKPCSFCPATCFYHLSRCAPKPEQASNPGTTTLTRKHHRNKHLGEEATS